MSPGPLRQCPYRRGLPGLLLRAPDHCAEEQGKGGRAVRRAVEIGHQNGLAAEVRSGLKEGDQVILHPSADVKEGAEVQGRAEL
jgi:HlyD family secretion protein